MNRLSEGKAVLRDPRWSAMPTMAEVFTSNTMMESPQAKAFWSHYKDIESELTAQVLGPRQHGPGEILAVINPMDKTEIEDAWPGPRWYNPITILISRERVTLRFAIVTRESSQFLTLPIEY
jgi:hypothetical protein